MGFENLGAFNLRFRLEFDDGLTPLAFHRHQVPQDPCRAHSTRTVDLADDPFGDRFQKDLPFHPPAAFTEVLIPQLRKRRPGDTGQQLPVIGAAEFVHDQFPRDGWLMNWRGKIAEGRE